MKEIRVYLDDILDSIEKIEEYTRGVNFEKFDSNTEHQLLALPQWHHMVSTKNVGKRRRTEKHDQ